MPPAGFEPAIPAIERPQTHALDRSTPYRPTRSESLYRLSYLGPVLKQTFVLINGIFKHVCDRNILL